MDFGRGQQSLRHDQDPAADSFMGFFTRSDQATIQIMVKAATIVPKACDILGISLSDSESEAEEENDDTAVAHGERSPPQSHHHYADEPGTDESSLAQIDGEDTNSDDSNNITTVDNHQVQEARPKPNFRARLLTPTRISGPETVLGSHVRVSRKRCVSTPSTLNLGQSKSSNSEELRNLNPPKNKKRRFPSISISGPGPDSNNVNGSGGSSELAGLDNNPAWGNLSPEDYAIRLRMRQDIELLQKQLVQLARIEKMQHLMMRKYLQVDQQQQQIMQLARNAGDSTTTAATSDGTNSLATATTFAISAEEELGFDADEGSLEIIDQADQGMNTEEINIMNDSETFTDADLNVGAEVVVGENDEDVDADIGSLL